MVLDKNSYPDKLVMGNLDAKRDWGHAKDYVYLSVDISGIEGNLTFDYHAFGIFVNLLPLYGM